MNRKRISILISSILGIAMLGSIMSGCAKKTEETAPAPKIEGGEVAYPIKSDGKVTYWVALNGNVSAGAKSLNDTEFAKKLIEKTGINVEFVHPAQGQEKEQFNLLIASGDMPDIVENTWISAYPGGPDKAMQDNVILKLNDTISKFAPNFNKFLKSNPDADKMLKTDNGSYYMFPFIRGDEMLTISYGPLLRGDWLKELGLSAPTTVAEWETVLTAFKEKKGSEAPFTISKNIPEGFISGAFGIDKGYYMMDGKVKYGPLEPAYKDYIQTLADWYKKGLLDKNFATLDGKGVNANITNGKSGATFGYPGSGIGTWMPAARATNPQYEIVAAPYPTKNKGETPIFGQKDFKVQGAGAAINAKSKNIELAARLLDYGYSKDGNLYYNFGTEGVSFKMENNYPKYTEVVTKNPNKLSMAQAIAQYARGSYSGPFVQNKEYIEQFYTLQQQLDALTIWSKVDAYKTKLPMITPTPEESAEIAKIDSELGTYLDEMTLKFIMGTAPMSDYGKFVEQIKKLNAEKAIQLKQAALDRFNKR